MMAREKFAKDPRGGHVRLYWALMDSPAWNSLSATDQRVYLTLRRALGQTNNGDLSLTLSRSRHYQVTSPATLAKALRGLVAVGLIAVTRRGGCTKGGQRLPTLYRFTDERVYPVPAKFIDASAATDDWKRVTSIAHGEALIRQAEATAHELAQKKRPLQFPNGTATAGEAVTPPTDTAAEAWRDQTVQKVKQATNNSNTLNSSNDAGFRDVATLQH
jgi:hypothetical protein